MDPGQLSLRRRRGSAETWLHSHGDGRTTIVLPTADVTQGVPGTGDPYWRVALLPWCLNYAPEGLEGLRATVAAARRLVGPDGEIVAVARAFDSGRELAERMVSAGATPTGLGAANLTSKEIACLRPDDAVALENVTRFRSRVESAQEFADRVFLSPRLAQVDFHLPDGFVVKTLDIGLTWAPESRKR